MELHKVRAVLKFESLLTVRQIGLFAPINVGGSHIMSSYVTSWKWRSNTQFIFLRLSEKKAEQNASRGNLLSLFVISAGTFNATSASQGLWGKIKPEATFILDSDASAVTNPISGYPYSTVNTENTAFKRCIEKPCSKIAEKGETYDSIQPHLPITQPHSQKQS